jgi:hypothetical protein
VGTADRATREVNPFKDEFHPTFTPATLDIRLLTGAKVLSNGDGKTDCMSGAVKIIIGHSGCELPHTLS